MLGTATFIALVGSSLLVGQTRADPTIKCPEGASLLELPGPAGSRVLRCTEDTGGKPHGPELTLAPNGFFLQRGQWDHGIRQRRWERWYPSGHVMAIFQYDRGAPTSSRCLEERTRKEIQCAQAHYPMGDDTGGEGGAVAPASGTGVATKPQPGTGAMAKPGAWTAWFSPDQRFPYIQAVVSCAPTSPSSATFPVTLTTTDATKTNLTVKAGITANADAMPTALTTLNVRPDEQTTHSAWALNVPCDVGAQIWVIVEQVCYTPVGQPQICEP